MPPLMEDDFPLIGSDLIHDTPLATQSRSGSVSNMAGLGVDGTSVVALEADAHQDGEDSRDESSIAHHSTLSNGFSNGTAALHPDLDDDDVEEDALPTPAKGGRTPGSGRKRKVAEAAVNDDEAEPEAAVPAKKRVRPDRTAAVPSARLAAKAASLPRRGRPKATTTNTVLKAGRGRPKVAKSSSIAVGRPKKNEEVPMGEYEVEEILDSGIDADTSEHRYYVKWKGFSNAENTWEPRSNLAHCPDLIKKYDAQRKLANRVSRKPKSAPAAKETKAESAAPKRPGRKLKAAPTAAPKAAAKAAPKAAAKAAPKRRGRPPRASA